MKKIAGFLTIIALVFFHGGFVVAQTLDATPPPTDTAPAEEAVTPPTDTTAPVISGVAVTSIGINEVTIVWSTDEAAVSTLEYGTTASYGQSATLPATALLAHTATLTGLTAGTTYHYCIHAVDPAGNKSSSCGHTFVTEAETATEPVITDSDSDGVSDAEEIGTEVIEESSPEAEVTDPEAFPDTDSDGTPNYLDPDDDGDGIPTETENTNATTTSDTTITEPDADADSVPDYLEPNTTDTDSDGETNNLDPDDDGDTVPTSDEVITDTSDTDAVVDEVMVDTDSDGIPNALDSDDDGDGISTINEDTNHDGSVINDDTDNDGVPNFEEPNNVDTDSDGLTNNADSDDDGDGVPTVIETHLPTPVPKINFDRRGGGGTYYNVSLLDSDGDSIPDYLDTNDDGDALLTIKEDDNNNKILTDDDADKDGLPNYLESNSRDFDKDGKKDVLDNEDDGDGILSKIDTNPYTRSCYMPRELGYKVSVVAPDGSTRAAGQYAKKTLVAHNVIRYDFELGSDSDFNDLAVRVNNEGHRSFVVTVMNSEVGNRYQVHLQILGDGEVEKDLTLWTNPRLVVNIPKRIMVKEYLTICADSENFCRAHITQYLKKGVNNDPAEVSKLQSFLVDQEGFTDVQVTGIFDNTTDVAVRMFQEKHSGIVLSPWAMKKGTGYVYRTTTKQINDLYCAAKKK